jgi:hypothetical protein
MVLSHLRGRAWPHTTAATQVKLTLPARSPDRRCGRQWSLCASSAGWLHLNLTNPTAALPNAPPHLPPTPRPPTRPQAAQAGPELAAATAARHAQLLLRQGDAPAAAAALARRGVSAADASLLAAYRGVALDVLGAPAAARSAQAEQDVRRGRGGGMGGRTAAAIASELGRGPQGPRGKTVAGRRGQCCDAPGLRG